MASSGGRNEDNTQTGLSGRTSPVEHVEARPITPSPGQVPAHLFTASTSGAVTDGSSKTISPASSHTSPRDKSNTPPSRRTSTAKDTEKNPVTPSSGQVSATVATSSSSGTITNGSPKTITTGSGRISPKDKSNTPPSRRTSPCKQLITPPSVDTSARHHNSHSTKTPYSRRSSRTATPCLSRTTARNGNNHTASKSTSPPARSSSTTPYQFTFQIAAEQRRNAEPRPDVVHSYGTRQSRAQKAREQAEYADDRRGAEVLLRMVDSVVDGNGFKIAGRKRGPYAPSWSPPSSSSSEEETQQRRRYRPAAPRYVPDPRLVASPPDCIDKMSVEERLRQSHLEQELQADVDWRRSQRMTEIGKPTCEGFTTDSTIEEDEMPEIDAVESQPKRRGPASMQASPMKKGKGKGKERMIG